MPLDRADVVVGYRARRAANVVRWLNSGAWNLNLLIRAPSGLPVRDIDYAFNLFRPSALAHLEPPAESAMIWTEHRIVEGPVSHYPRRHGTPSDASVESV